MAKTALLIGATGLIGTHLLDTLLDDTRYDKIKLIVRRQLNGSNYHEGLLTEKVEQCIIDFDKIDEYSSLIQGDDVFICVGTTIKKVGGDKDAFRKVDFDVPVNMARIAAQNNVQGCFVISSLGADANSSNFYLKTKGEMEEAVKQYKFSNLCFLRPSLLTGSRNEVRIGESIGKFFMTLFGFFFIGPLKNYKPIPAKVVAIAMLEIANTQPTKTVYESAQLASITFTHIKNVLAQRQNKTAAL